MNIWVAASATSSVSTLSEKNGAKRRTFPVESGPTGLLFDGNSIWVACQGADTVNKISRAAP